MKFPCVYPKVTVFLIFLIFQSSVLSQFAAPVLLQSVTSFQRCIETGGDDPAANAQCETMDADEPLTVIRTSVAPERVGVDQANFLTFYAFPETTDTVPVNEKQADQIDLDAPCADLPQGSNCNVFASPINTTNGTSSVAAPLVMTFETSSFVRSYQLQRKNIRVPYAYLDYNALLLGCDPNANQYLCTMIVEITVQYAFIVSALCFFQPLACTISWVLATASAFCLYSTVGVAPEVNSETSSFYFDYWRVELEPALLAAGVSPTLLNEYDALVNDIEAALNSGNMSALQPRKWLNANSRESQITDAINVELCGLTATDCDSLPPDIDPESYEAANCETCVLRVQQKKQRPGSAWICRNLYVLPSDYCEAWNPLTDPTVCSVSDAAVFFGDWITLMNPTYNLDAGAGQGAAGSQAETRNTKDTDVSYECRGSNNRFLAALTPNFEDRVITSDRDYNAGPCYSCPVDIIGAHEANNVKLPKNPDTIAQLCPAMNAFQPFCYLNTTTPRFQVGVGSAAQTTAAGDSPAWYCIAEQNARGNSRSSCKSPMSPYPQGYKFDGVNVRPEQYYSLWTEAADSYLCSTSPGSRYFTDNEEDQTCHLWRNLERDRITLQDAYRAVNSLANANIRSCPIDEGGTFEIPYGRWERPGDRGLGVRPSQGANDFYIARCSAGCETNPTFVQRFKFTGQLSATQIQQALLIPDIIMTQMRQRASLWMGGPQCTVYEIQPVPYGEMEINVTLTYPDGSRERTTVQSSNGPNFEVNLGDVPFTVRVNRLNVPDSATGPLITGLIVVCGTTDVDLETDCDLGQGFDGQIRGRVPGDTDQYTNPWSKIIELALKKRAESETSGSVPEDEETQCPLPIPYYMGDLNCGHPAYWYYVPFIDTSTYGNGCGQNGFDQRRTENPSSAAQICQQGSGGTCTPGYGLPSFGGLTNGRQARSACQELGILNNYTGASRDTPCAIGQPAPRNMPPGFSYTQEQTDTYDSGDPSQEYRVVPNMWLDGTKLRILNKYFQGLVRADISVYIEADLDSETITIVPGSIATDAMYCGAALNTASQGLLGVIILNESVLSPGTYLVEANCSSELTSNTVSVNPPSFQIQTLGPQENTTVEFQVSVVDGAFALGDTRCDVTLYGGGGVVSDSRLPNGGYLDKVKVSCDLFLPQLIQYVYQDFQINARGTGCNSWDFFCILQNQPWYIRYIVYVVLGFIVIGLTIIAISVFIYGFTKLAELNNKSKIWKALEDKQGGAIRQ